MFDRCDYPFFYFQLSNTLALSLAACASICIYQLLPRRTVSLTEANVEWLLTRCEQLEQRLSEKENHYEELKAIAAASQAKYLQLERHFLSNEDRYERRCRELESDNTRLHTAVGFQQRSLRLQPFVSFFDRVLLSNKVWQQQAELTHVKGALVEREQNIRSYAFINFRDRLIVSNIVWKQQKQMKKLREDSEKMKKGRVRAVARAAKQMVLDTRKEGMVEELVKGLIKDIEKGKKRETELKDRYNEDIQKLNSEIDALKLAQRTRLIEQELSNGIEDRLIASLAESRKEVCRLEATGSVDH